VSIVKRWMAESERWQLLAAEQTSAQLCIIYTRRVYLRESRYVHREGFPAPLATVNFLRTWHITACGSFRNIVFLTGSSLRPLHVRHPR
jgi:hypothetical protein